VADQGGFQTTKLSLVGQAYPDRSPAVSVQAMINIFAQLIQDPNEQEKNKAALCGCPGKHELATLATDIRGLWSGAGRLFVASGLNLIELDDAGGTVSSNAYAASDDGLPVQIFSNGNQLLIITGGFAYIDDGTGPVPITMDNISGFVNTSGTTATWVSGDQFNLQAGDTVTVNGSTFTVAASPAPTPTSFDTTASLGTHTNVAYSATGEPLTAVSGAFLDSTFFVQRPPTTGQPTYGRRVNFSAVLDGFTWSSLDFFEKEAYPDNLRGLHVDCEQLDVEPERRAQR
jgi:hypothetical protein